MAMCYSLTILCLCSVVNAQDNALLFFRSKPSFEPAKLEVDGFVHVPSESGSPLLVSNSNGIRLLPRTEDHESRIEQRFLGFQRLWPILNIAGNAFPLTGFRRSQSVIQTVTSTHVSAPLCLLCSCTLGAVAFVAGNCGNNLLNNLAPLPGQPAVCGAGPNVGLVPPPCPTLFKREADDVVVSHEDIEASPVLPLIPTRPPGELQTGAGREQELSSSMDTTYSPIHGRKIIIKEEEVGGYDVIVTSFVTTVTTVTGSVTAQIQVGGLNCLPAYLQTVNRCTNIGF